MWSDIEMLIMSLCCVGLGFTLGIDWSTSKRKGRR